MKTALTLLFLLFVISAASGQNNILLLQKKQKTVRQFYAGRFIALETVTKSYAEGLVTKVTNDSIYIRFFEMVQSITQYGGVYFDTSFRYTTAIHVKDIGAIVIEKKNSNRKRNGSILMVAGGGVMVLGAVNGLYRGDPPKDWYKPSGYITAAALIVTGYFLSKSAVKKYRIGKKYQLKILALSMR
jgi:hypothetical protein